MGQERRFYDNDGSNYCSIRADATLSSNRDIVLPDAAGTLSLQDGTETLENKTIAAPTITGNIANSLTTGVTAGATQTQGGATALTTDYVNVTTCATDYDGVALPTAVAGKSVVIKNSGASILRVWPFLADSINALAVNLSVDIPVGGMKRFNAISDTVWETDEVIYANAGTTQTGGFGIAAVDNAANHEILLKNASHGQATVHSLPDPGQATGTVDIIELAQTVTGVKTMTTPVLNDATFPVTTAKVTTGVGTVTVSEVGDALGITTTTLTLTNFIVGTLAGAAADLAVGNIVCVFPAGVHQLVSSYMSLALTAAGTAVGTTDLGMGSVIATGAVATLDGTSTFEDRHTGSAFATDSGGGATATFCALPTDNVGPSIAANDESAIKNVFLNCAATWNADNTGNLTATGTIILKWIKFT